MCYGLNKEEFLELTVDEVRAYEDAYLQMEKKRDSRTAQICWILAEINRDKGRRPYKITDFMPRYRKSKRELLEQVEKFKQYLKLLG